MKKARFFISLVIFVLLLYPFIYGMNQITSKHSSVYLKVLKSTARVQLYGNSTMYAFMACDEKLSSVAEIMSGELGVDVDDVTIFGTEMRSVLDELNLSASYTQVRYVILPVILEPDFVGVSSAPEVLCRSAVISMVSMAFNRAMNTMMEWRYWDIAGYGQNAGSGDLLEADKFLIGQKALEGKCNNEIRQYSNMGFVENNIKLNYTPPFSIVGDQDFVRTIRRLRDKRIVPIVYIGPVNYEYMKKTMGDEFYSKFAREMLRVQKYLMDNGIDFVDMSESLPDEYFIDRWCACNHMKYEGRRYVAKFFADELSRLGYSFDPNIYLYSKN